MPSSFLPDIDALDAELTRPTPALVSFISSVKSPLVVLGAGGKMGPTLCALAVRAAAEAGHALDVVAVSRFSDPAVQTWLDAQGVHTHIADLLDPAAVRALPDAPNVIYLVGRKFGTGAQPGLTWLINTTVPVLVSERYAGVPVVMLSTGNVYPLVPVTGGGSVETDPLAPVGTYAYACLAREQVFAGYADRYQTPTVLVRLNYAVDLRYGVLLDLAQRIWHNQPVDLAMGHLNCIWQGDANARILRALALAGTPAVPLNLTGPQYAVADLAQRLGRLLERRPRLTGTPAETALLSNAARSEVAFGPPEVDIDTLLRWTAHWVQTGQPTLGKPTAFQVRDGKF